MSSRNSLLLAALFGFTSVLLGAFGAHSLKKMLTPEALAWVETGVRYQMFHALALLFVSSIGDGHWVKLARGFWCVGVVIFCGSLYALAFSAPRWFGAIAPIGGTALMLGWLALAAHAYLPQKLKRR